MGSLTKTKILSIGLMMFSIFFGAGNLIFPPALGQAAGENMPLAIIGFLITGVGLPLLGIVAIAVTGGDYTKFISERIHPRFAAALLSVLYLTIGPLFAIPRTGAVSFEIGIRPLLVDSNADLGQMIYTLVFFGLTYYLALNPSKIVERVGNWLTPLLLLFLAILFTRSFISPLGDFMGATGQYAVTPLLQGFQDGYLTMDLLASLAVGAIVVNAVKGAGVEQPKEIGRICIAAGVISILLMSLVYVSLGYLGATSRATLGLSENGGVLLSQTAFIFFGTAGNSLLAAIIAFACLTTSCGMASACAWFFNDISGGRLPYRRVLQASVLFSLFFANVGLTELIRISIPFLTAIYPVVIVLVLLSLAHDFIGGSKEVYQWAIGMTVAFSVFDGLHAAGLQPVVLDEFFSAYVPLYAVQLGWIVPAVIGLFIGLIAGLLPTERAQEAQ